MTMAVSALSGHGNAMDILIGVISAIIAVCANVAGLAFSHQFDSPMGPTIACVVAFLFVA